MSTATLEQPKPAAPPAITEQGTTALAELSARQNLLAALKQEFAGLKCDTKEGYAATHAAIQRLVKIRTSTEEKAAELKAGAREWINNVILVEKMIIGTAKAIEGPLRTMKAVVDEAEERERQAKIDAERERLAAIERQRLAEEAARIKAEQDKIAEANRIEAEKNRAEREKLEKFRAEMAAAQKELDDKRKAQEAEAAAEKAKVEAAAQAERDRIEAEARAAREKIEAERAAHERHQTAERAKLIEEQRELDRAKAEAARIEREKVEAAERAAREEREAKEAAELAERQRVEAEERAKVEAARLEALKPDREKLAKWAAKIWKAAESRPALSTPEGDAIAVAAVKRLCDTAEYVQDFAEV